MGQVASDIKQSFVDFLYDEAVDNNTTILALLKAANKARVEQFQSGLILISTLANRQQSSFAIDSEFTPSDARSLVAEIRRRYREAVAKLQADGISSPTDTQIYNELLRTIQPNRGAVSDFTYLRLEPSEVGVSE